jgi:hypothetical protein
MAVELIQHTFLASSLYHVANKPSTFERSEHTTFLTEHDFSDDDISCEDSFVAQVEESLSSSEQEVEEEESNTKVRFSYVQIRGYSQTIGDNPSVSNGTPIQLDWDYQDYGAIDCNLYEYHRGSRRSREEMIMNHVQRRNLLKHVYGRTDSELNDAKVQVQTIKKQRYRTNRRLSYMPVEAALESAGRKAKKILGRRR